MSPSFDLKKRAIDAVVKSFFAAIANKNGQAPKLVDLKSICLPNCRIVKTCGESPVHYGLAGFIAPRPKLLTEGELVGFSEDYARNLSRHIADYVRQATQIPELNCCGFLMSLVGILRGSVAHRYAWSCTYSNGRPGQAVSPRVGNRGDFML